MKFYKIKGKRNAQNTVTAGQEWLLRRQGSGGSGFEASPRQIVRETPILKKPS
jgi:hypothetical protein